jgi:hypothetical protein
MGELMFMYEVLPEKYNHVKQNREENTAGILKISGVSPQNKGVTPQRPSD